MKANTNLEARLAMIICLEAKIEAHETKIADLDALKGNVIPLNETGNDRPEMNKKIIVNGKRPMILQTKGLK